MTDLPVGALIAEKYRVVAIIGRGGMGTVYSAAQVEVDERVAVKVLLESATENEEMVARFVNEAKAAMRIKSEHICKVMDFGRHEGETPYMVMEYLEGKDLGQIVTEGGTTQDQAIDWFIQAVDGVGRAHALGIVHRDLKPSNLFLAQLSPTESIIKVLDFGISKTTDHGHVSLTATRATLGSPLYMSPEQLRSSKNVDSRADIWSLGVILFELLTGRTPFIGETVGEVFANVIEAKPVPLRQHLPSAAPELEQIILRCLEKKPENRFQSAAELGEALLPWGTAEHRVALATLRRVTTARSTRASGAISTGSAMLPGAPPSSRSLLAATMDDTSSPNLPVAGSSSPQGAMQMTAASWGDADDPFNQGKKKKWAIGGGIVAIVGGGALAVLASSGNVDIWRSGAVPPPGSSSGHLEASSVSSVSSSSAIRAGGSVAAPPTTGSSPLRAGKSLRPSSGASSSRPTSTAKPSAGGVFQTNR